MASLLLAPAEAPAGAGRTAAPLLQETFGGRPRAMGQAYVALADDAFGLTFNPAGLSRLTRAQAAAQYSEDILDVRQAYFALALPLSASHALGLSASLLDAGRIEIFDSLGTPLRSVSAQTDQLVQLGYSYAWVAPPFSREGALHLGFSGKYLRSVIVEELRGQAFAGDAGLLYSQALRRQGLLSAGLSIANIGPGMRFTGGKASGRERDPLPRTLRAGAAYQRRLLRYDRLTLSAQVDRVFYEDLTVLAAGLEYLHRGLLAVRFGYRREEDVGPLSFGVGLSWKDLELDYSLSLLEVFGTLQKVSLAYSFNIPWVESRRPLGDRASGYSMYVLSRRIEKAVQEKRHFDAMDGILKFLDLFPDDSVVLSYREQVAQAVNATVRKGLFEERAYYAMGHQTYYEGKWARAAQWLQQALEREPDNEEIKRVLSGAQRKITEAQELDRLKNAARISYLYELASKAHGAGDSMKAERIVKEILSISPYEPALRLREALRRAPESAPAPRRPKPAKEPPRPVRRETEKAAELFYQAVRKYSQGDLEGSVFLLRRAYEYDPQSLDIQSTLQRAERELKTLRKSRRRESP